MKRFWRLFRAKRAAVAVIAPLVERSRMRLGRIPDHAWRQPYLIGFLGMLISLVAVEASRGRLRGEQLGLAQIDVWMLITGMPDDSIGEEICLLSASGDKAFIDGCRNAASFHAVLAGRPDPAAADICDPELPASPMGPAFADTWQPGQSWPGTGDTLAAALWKRYFDNKIN